MNLIDKIQKKHTEVLDFYSSEKLTERERNLLRTEMAFLLELKSDAEALNIDFVSKSVCTACSGGGYYCGNACGACDGTGLETDC